MCSVRGRRSSETRPAGIDADVRHVTDMAGAASPGVLFTPGLAIDGTLIPAGWRRIR